MKRQKIRTEEELKDFHFQYYTQTASVYDEMHVHPNDEHYVALQHIVSLADGAGISNFLDVGSGTGRAIKYLLEKGLKVHGLEPVPALIEQAVAKHGLDTRAMVCGVGERLPFAAESFDAVCEFGMLHHVPNPNLVVKEMTRVARKAVFISDSNRFGQGRMSVKLLKLSLAKMRLWRAANFIKTRGKGYTIMEGDGLAYSYSVFDSYDLLASWATKIILIPTSTDARANWCHPLLTSGNVLVCAFKEA